LLAPTNNDAVFHTFQYIGRLYARQFNYQYARTGALFDDRYKSCQVQDHQYLLNCLQYIELNPVRAGMVNDPGDYRWSSYKSHALGKPVNMWTPHPMYLALRATQEDRMNRYLELIGDALTVEAVAEIRHCSNTGLVLGTAEFRQKVEALRL
jgi:putative transposase